MSSDTQRDGTAGRPPAPGGGAWQRLLQAGASRRTMIKATAGGLGAGVVSAGLAGGWGATAAAQQAATPGSAPGGLPNILAIMGDDIGYWNLSAYNLGMMGYRTPNIDRIAREGMLFTDAYGEQSCTAGRAAFITGQSPFRTGLLKIGMPGEKQGLSPEDPTIAELLKPLGYATGQFGKNHVGDRNEHLPTVHGFDEFFGVLYHLNAYEEPENPDYPSDPEFFEKYGPRNIVHTYASEVDDPTEDPRFGPVGKQVIEDAGVLDTTRMETFDQEVLTTTMDFIDRASGSGQPFFVWFNSTRAHIFTHLSDEAEGATGLGVEADAIVEHDAMIGQLLQQLDDLGIADNTIVLYITDNGAELFSWPDGGMTPFRSEKNSNWEGAFRIPQMVRWPGRIPAGSISNDVFSLQDWLPTLMAAAGIPDVSEQLLDGYQAGDKRFRVHIDGYNQLDHVTSGGENPRSEYFYFSDSGDLVGLRTRDRWKVLLMEQQSSGLDVWFEPFDDLRTPRIVDMRGDPFERALDESSYYDDWLVRRLFVLYPVRETLQAFFETFALYPPRQPDSVLGRYAQLIESMRHASGG